MRLRFLLAMLLAFITCVADGCVMVTSREPLYDAKKDRVFDKDLLGTWSDGESLRVRIEPDGAHSYMWTDLGEADAHPTRFDLVGFDGRRYMFLTGCTMCDEQAQDLQAEEHTGLTNVWLLTERRSSMPTFRVERAWDVLRLRMLDGSGMYELLQKQPDTLEYEFDADERSPFALTVENGRGIQHPFSGSLHLNDSAKNIRRFLNRHANDRGVWSEPIDLRRVRE